MTKNPKLPNLIALAERIKDKKLRQKTVDALKNPELSSHWKLKPADLERVPSWLSGHHSDQGGLIRHVKGMTELAIEIANVLQKSGIKVNVDYVIAASLLHDMGKLYHMEYDGKWKFTPLDLEHDILGAAELYARGFPEVVVKAVATHGGQVPANPTTIEGLIVHHADVIDAAADNMSRTRRKIVLSGEDILAALQS